MFVQLVLSGMMVGAVYALIALGFVLIFKSSGVLNLAQGELMLFGVFISWSLIASFGLPIWVGILTTLALCALLGTVLERLALRPMIGQSVFAIVMMTIALSIVLRSTAQIIWGAEQRGFPEIFPLKSIHIGGVVLSEQLVWIFGIALLAVVAFSLYFNRTGSGLAMRAVAENHQVAQSVGVSVKRIFSNAWAICAIIAGVGGFLLATFSGANFEISHLGLKALPVVLLGGLESIPGAIIAGLFIGVAENLAGGYLDPFITSRGILGGGVKEIFPFILMLFVLLVRPYGLFGLRRIERI